MENEHSIAYEMLGELKKNNKRLFISIIIILTMWLLTICGFLYYLSLYDFVTETTQEVTDTDNSNISQEVS